jgi:hypothetical protein
MFSVSDSNGIAKEGRFGFTTGTVSPVAVFCAATTEVKKHKIKTFRYFKIKPLVCKNTIRQV